MALGTVNITMTAIRDSLGESTLRLSELCLSTLINKWSKYKPVGGVFPQSIWGTYGLSLIDSSWSYLRPRGNTYSEPYRMGDFRGYEHDKTLAFPSIQCRQSECTLRTIYPVGNTNYYNLWKVRFFKDASDVIITPTDLGLGAYYFGIAITVGGVTYYKTKGTIAEVGSDGMQFTVDASLINPSVAQFVDLPYGSGVYNWRLILCSTAAPSWTTAIPANVIDFPADVLPGYTLIKSGSFTVANWIMVSDNSHSFIDYAAPSKSSTVMYSSGGAFTINNPISSWCEVEVWDEDMLVERTAHPETWVTGSVLVFKVTNNYGAARNGVITISANGASATISIAQDAVWVDPIVYAFDTVGEWNVVNTSYSFNVEAQQLTVSFEPSGLSGTSVTLYIAAYREGEEKVEITSSGRDGYQTTEVLNLGEVIPTGAQYTVYISTSPINIIPI